MLHYNTKDTIISINNTKHAVVLLEGTRKLSAKDTPKLIRLSEQLTTACPKATFRTGNASGTDEAFAQGVANINPNQLEYVIPYRTMRQSKLLPGARVLSLQDLPETERHTLKTETVKSYPKIEKIIDHYFETSSKSRISFKALYLLRDTLKVIGSKGLGLYPATLGLFYVNSEKPLSGGTGHTIRVCEQNGVNVLNQLEWEVN